MVKFVVVTIKSKSQPQIVEGQLVDVANILNVAHAEAAVNEWVLKGFHIIETMILEDLRGHYILFVFYKRGHDS